MAAGLDAHWFGAYVESRLPLSDSERQVLSNNLGLVKELGGEVLETVDDDAVKGLLRLAREHQITQLVVGKSRRGFWHNLTRGGSVTRRLLDESGSLDIYVVSGEPQPAVRPAEKLFGKTRPRLDWKKYLAALAAPVVLAGLGQWLGRDLGYHGIGFLFLLGVTVLGIFIGRGPAVLAALVSSVLWDVLFMPPKYTFTIASPEDFMLLLLFLGIAFVVGHLTSQLRRSEELLELRERRIAALYQMTREFAAARSLEAVFSAAVAHLGAVFDAEVAVLVPGPDRRLIPYAGGTLRLDEKERTVASWVAIHRRPAGLFTETLPAARAFYLPLVASAGSVGVLGLMPRKLKSAPPDFMTLAETFARQLAIAIERETAPRNPGA